jgi:triacylglycerol lipase
VRCSSSAAYALVLGLEFSLLRLAHGARPHAARQPAQLLAAWWAEVQAAPLVFCWRQPFSAGAGRTTCLPTPAAAAACCWCTASSATAVLWNPWLQRLHAQGVPFMAVNLEPVFGSIDDYIGILEQAVRRLEKATGLAPVIVAHSMGGLAVRRWWAEHGDEAACTMR